jgi:hypothetical protein
MTSAKSLFNKTLTSASLAIAEGQVESKQYFSEYKDYEDRYVPQIDFSNPSNFIRYGSAEKYYEDTIYRIYQTYPYDGSLKERVEWHNSSSYFDNYILEEEYPRTTGYATFSPDGWGTQTDSDTIVDTIFTASTLGEPSIKEYVTIHGGPNVNNIYDTTSHRESNLQMNFDDGVTVEMFVKVPTFPSGTNMFTTFDQSNYSSGIGSLSYGRMWSFFIYNDGQVYSSFLVSSGSTTNQMTTPVDVFSTIEDQWVHYVYRTYNSGSDFVIDQYINSDKITTETFAGAALNEVTGAIIGTLGAMKEEYPSPMAGGTVGGLGWCKLSGSVDEFRYWKTKRSDDDIKKYWFTQVGSGVNTDTSNTDLGVYYKFNEGITEIAATDAVVLDYSGRVSNGSWTGYGTNSRSTDSALEESSASMAEFQDPIIYSTHPDVVSYLAEKQTSGSIYDNLNNGRMIDKIPSWVIEEDREGKVLENLIQTVSSYFDTLHLQSEILPSLGHIHYVSGSEKQKPFVDTMLRSKGLEVPEIFSDASALEKFHNRGDSIEFSEELKEVKNSIYQNIYNNLVHIYKSKGTEQSFRNLMRCYGIDEELVKLHMYGDNVTYELKDNRKLSSTPKKGLDFHKTENSNATVYQSSGSYGTEAMFIPGWEDISDKIPLTFESTIVFPRHFDIDNELYYSTPISSSIFGTHGVKTEEDYTWPDNDYPNFQVYAVKERLNSANVYFVLTSSIGLYLTSSTFYDVYDDSRWTLAVRYKPNNYPVPDFVSGASDKFSQSGSMNNYDIELYGVRTEPIVESFAISSSIDVTITNPGTVKDSRRLYVGAHRTNFTGSVLQQTDVKILSMRAWLDYLDDEEVYNHSLGVTNYGRSYPGRSANTTI